MLPEVSKLLEAFPSVLEFLIVMGVIATAMMAVIKLWQLIRPNFNPELDKVRKDVEQIISISQADLRKDTTGLKTELTKDIAVLYKDVERLSNRTIDIERSLASIDVGQINNRFDRIESKIDDFMSAVLTKLSK